ncbi:MAG TPA: hypothetical protein VJR25_01235, partial [Microbacterium sp.]|nr:hypothetical protein [Microbacterium sp.]
MGTSARGGRSAGALAVGAVLLLAIAACTGMPRPGPTASLPGATASPPEPTASTPATPAIALAPVRVGVAPGADAGAARGRSLNVPRGWTAQVWADV